MLEVVNLTEIKIDTKFLQKVAQAAFAVLGIKEEVSLVFIGDAKMKELNKKYRGKNKTTDVLSFKELSEIFICLSQAKRQAKFYNSPHPPLKLRGGAPPLKLRGGWEGLSPLNCELTRLLAHGIVHLQGYDHAKSAREAKRMFSVEEKILKKIIV